jgi:hypothetical protein
LSNNLESDRTPNGPDFTGGPEKEPHQPTKRTLDLEWGRVGVTSTSKFLLKKELTLMPLANLRYRIGRTKSKAWHPIKFVGALGIWPGFKTEVKTFINIKASKWKKDAIKIKLHDPDPNLQETEQVLVANEHGVQGRW